jgi:hypothetical protein
MDEVRIPNRATYWPTAPIDMLLAAPFAARLLLGASPVGRIVQAAALTAYLGSALQDWRARQDVRRIPFRREFGADLRHLTTLPDPARREEIRLLTQRLNDEYTAERIPRRELAVVVDTHLTRYIAGITGQRVESSTEVRNFSVVHLVFPFALGACDPLSGDIAIFKDTGVFEPHVIAHEFCHRKGYWKELEAQVLAYMALTSSGERLLVQAALAERLHRNLRVLAGDSAARFRELVAESGLRPELSGNFLALQPAEGTKASPVESAIRRLYDERLKLTGQNGISDYDLGFTNFLYTFETSPAARQAPPPAGTVHRRPPRALPEGPVIR